MKLTTIRLIHLRNGGYIQYMRDYLEILDKHGPPAGLQEECQALSDTVDAIEEVFRQRQDSDFTTKIAQLDKLRDQYLMSMASVIKGYLGHFDTAKIAAAKTLHRFIAMYGTPSGIARRPLAEQCTIVEYITSNMQERPKGVAAINLLGISDWVAALRVANTELSEAYVARSQEAAHRPSETIEDLRVECNAGYYRLRDMVAAQALTTAYAAPYDDIIRTLNALTEQFNQVLAQRSGNHSKDDKQPED